MKQFFKTLFASMLGMFLGIILFSFLVMTLIGVIFFKQKTDLMVKEEIDSPILYIHLNKQIVEKVDASPFDFAGDVPFFKDLKNIGLYQLQKTIEQAAKDPKIKMMYLKMGSVQAGWSSLNSIYQSLEKFKKAGKPIITYSESYSEESYYLSTLAQKIYLYPAGNFEFNGMASVQGYFKGLFEKLEVKPQIFRVGKFKSAIEPFTLDKMSEESRKQTIEILNDLWGDVLMTVEKNRQIPVNDLSVSVDAGGIYNAEMAIQRSLVDELTPEYDVISMMKYYVSLKNEKEKTDLWKMTLPQILKKAQLTDEKKKIVKAAPAKEEKAAKVTVTSVDTSEDKWRILPKEMINWEKYFHQTEIENQKKISALNSKNQVALYYLEGEMIDGEASEGRIGSANVVQTLRQLEKDEEVKAIVLRINSPGGSALAADVIWNEIERIKKDKPIIASLGDVAASGGYYIASNCQHIFAQPGTITGSIGVFGMHFSLNEFFKSKLGVTFDQAMVGKYADTGTMNRELRSEEIKIIQSEVEKTYERFLNRVASGRKNLTVEEVSQVAEGRVWSGKKAKEIKLVNSLGGVDESLHYAASLAKLNKDYYLQTYPVKKMELMDLLLSLEGFDVLQGKFLSAVGSFLAPDAFLQKEESIISSLQKWINERPANHVYTLMPMNMQFD